MSNRYALPKVDAVRQLPAFSRCTDRELANLTLSADELDLDAGAVLMREGEVARETFLILSGQLTVRLCGAYVATVGPGETVGEMAVIDPGPCSATVVAQTPVRALVFGRRQVDTLLDQAGPARAVARILSARLREADAGLRRESSLAG